MPLYEYRCSACGKTFELLQSITAEPIKICIYCQGPVLKMLSAPAFQFKGSGWYITDYKKKKEAEKSVSTGKAPEAPEKTNNEKKGESLPASEKAKAKNANNN